jgi:hypothetical protein
MTLADEALANAVAHWARSRPDIHCLAMIGSQVQASGLCDEWSDLDYQLITSRPSDYDEPEVFRTAFPEVASVACAKTFDGVTKATAIGPGCEAVDFAVIPLWQIRIAFAALQVPRTSVMWPTGLRRGVNDLRVTAGAGWQIVIGGAAWARRYRRLVVAPPVRALTQAQFSARRATFAVTVRWVQSKLARGEHLAAQREYHRVLVEVFSEVALDLALAAGKTHLRPELRHAEHWMDPASYAALAAPFIAGDPPAELLASTNRLRGAFDRLCGELAATRGFTL